MLEIQGKTADSTSLSFELVEPRYPGDRGPYYLLYTGTFYLRLSVAQAYNLADKISACRVRNDPKAATEAAAHLEQIARLCERKENQ